MSYSPSSEFPHSLLPLLKQLSTAPDRLQPSSITSAILAISVGDTHPLQTAALLTALHYTTLDTHPTIIAAAAAALRTRGIPVHHLHAPPPEYPTIGEYKGGLVDMVGTGGDGHDTYNVSTTAAVIAAGAGLRVAKHGSKASSSMSGSADLLMALGAKIMDVDAVEAGKMLCDGLDNTNGAGRFCFLYAPLFHPAMKTVAEVRRELGCRTIFNVLGPIISPIDFSAVVGRDGQASVPGYEARLLGVGHRRMGPVYADTLRLLGVKKALVVCGDEDLDEVSIAGNTHCWRVTKSANNGLPNGTSASSADEIAIETFMVHPTHTFGLSTHPLSECGSGGTPAENAVIFQEIVQGARKRGDPVRDFVVVNAASFLVAAGACEGDEEIGEDGIMRGSRWTDAVKRVESALEDGAAWKAWSKFVEGSEKAAAFKKLKAL
ncbi:anthranilate phosphoribosyltransferase [Ascodesmis nigricans]|uniref:Anthranilate phosphoribosyltransferase n=1 Tax=Ascodesmis nigricans TaxID=341454 RepID=A0A4S2MZB4_9PEZI|nr:anthranilate phosphoribosyltransferase [Ascodesmis nigricans]